MKFVMMLFVCLGLALGPIGLAVAQPVEGAAEEAPKMVILGGEIYDAGDITPGTTVSHVFMIENQGRAELILKDVRPGCGCMVANYDRAIAPGGQGRVTVRVKVYREWAGQELSKSTWVTTNDPQMPQAQLTISGQILPAAGASGPPASAQ